MDPDAFGADIKESGAEPLLIIPYRMASGFCGEN
jgi:hypothetical protein